MPKKSALKSSDPDEVKKRQDVLRNNSLQMQEKRGSVDNKTEQKQTAPAKKKKKKRKPKKLQREASFTGIMTRLALKFPAVRSIPLQLQGAFGL